MTIDSNKTFLLPSYLCHTVIQPFRELGLKFKFYKVTENLKVDLNYLKSVISPDIEGILFIHYFGFKQESEFLELIMELRDKGVKVIEDLSQALLTENIGQYGDYSLTSFRKFLPVPDGGYLKSIYHNISKSDLKQGYNEFWGRRLLGLIYKDLYISNNIGKKDFFLINFSEAEKAYDTHIEITSISDYSRKIIRKFDFQNIKKQRRINFQFLLEKLKHVPGISLPYDHLPENVCPAGFPIITQKRDLLKEKFIKERFIHRFIGLRLKK